VQWGIWMLEIEVLVQLRQVPLPEFHPWGPLGTGKSQGEKRNFASRSPGPEMRMTQLSYPPRIGDWQMIAMCTWCPYSALVASRTKTTTLEVYLHFWQFKSPIDCWLISFIFFVKTTSRKVMPAPMVYADLL
jgi:hypothetical protein